MSRNKRSVFAQLGASNHTVKDREKNDYYATDPHTIQIFLDKLKEDNFKLHNKIWECACGEGHISKILINKGYEVYSSDLIDRGFGNILDFLDTNYKNLELDILTNPPYKFGKEFVEKSLETVEKGHYVIMLLKIQFLESKSRLNLFKENPPIYIYIYKQ